MDTPANLIELRDISYEDAKRAIRAYFAAHHGEEIDAADIEEALGIELDLIVPAYEELEKDGLIKAL